ncbi:MAG TPA: hypothetical protein VHZ81_09500 [Galbitalea sp.]|nr:hypothetical protein [Galbitalea sp.]
MPSSEPDSLCIPLLMDCSTPAPTPTPTDPSGGSGGGLIGGLLGGTSAPGGIPVIPLVTSPDPDAPTMTLPAAQLGGSSLSFTGLQGVSLVTVRLANGDRTTVIRLAADSITINDFSLDVRPSGDTPGLVSTATQMRLQGHVVAYVDSVSATLLGGLGLTLGADTPIPSNEKLPSTLLSVNLGLVGVTANSIHFDNSHQFFE